MANFTPEELEKYRKELGLGLPKVNAFKQEESLTSPSIQEYDPLAVLSPSYWAKEIAADDAEAERKLKEQLAVNDDKSLISDNIAKILNKPQSKARSLASVEEENIQPQSFIPFKSQKDKELALKELSVKKPLSKTISNDSTLNTTSINSEDKILKDAIEETAKKPQETDILALLEQAKQNRDKQQLLANLGMAGETLSSAIGGMVSGGAITKPTGTDFYRNLAKQAEDRISDVGTQVSLQAKQEDINKAIRRRDPSSDESMLAKETYKELFGKPAPENLTAEAFEKVAPTMTNLMSQREARRAREAEIEQRRLDREILREKGYNEKQEKAIISARDEVKTKGYKDAFDMYKNAERLSNTLDNLSPGMYADVISTLQSAKLFQGDASVVRGPELKELQSAVGVLDRLKNEVDRLKGTGKLQPKQRKEILNAVNTIKNVSKKEYTSLLRPAATQFSRRGLPLEEIFDPRVLPEVQEALGLKTSEIETQTKRQLELPKDKKYVPGSRITTKRGSYIVDPNGLTATEE